MLRRRVIRWGVLTASTSGALILFATVFFLTTFGGLRSLSLVSSSSSELAFASDLIEPRRRVIRFGNEGAEIQRKSLVNTLEFNLNELYK